MLNFAEKDKKIVIKDLKDRLASLIYDADWHAKRFQECEEKILSFKETIAELESR